MHTFAVVDDWNTPFLLLALVAVVVYSIVAGALLVVRNPEDERRISTFLAVHGASLLRVRRRFRVTKNGDRYYRVDYLTALGEKTSLICRTSRLGGVYWNRPIGVVSKQEMRRH